MNDELSKAVEKFLEEAVHSRAAVGTREAYRVSVARFFTAAKVESLADARELGQATPREIQKVVQRLERDYKPASVMQTIVATRQFYKQLRLDEPEIQNPLVDVTVPVPDNTPEWNVLHQGQTKELIEQIDSPNERAVVLTLVLQGWRVSEFCRMTWKHVRKQGDSFVVEWRAKRNKLRTQRLQPTVVEAIEALHPEGHVAARPLVPDVDGRPYDRFKVYRLVRRHAKALGLKVTPHGLRATYTSSVIDRKGIELAQKLVGHSSIATTQRYNRWKPDADDDLDVGDL